MMIESLIFAPLLVAAQTQTVAAQAPDDLDAARAVLTIENKAVIRCTAAFALVAAAQDRGDTNARQWPVLGDRGREFFVRTLADLIDEHDFDRSIIGALVRSEAVKLNASGETGAVMPGCLLMLESSGID